MRRLGKFLSLRLPEKLLLLKCLVVVAGVRVALFVAPYRLVARLIPDRPLKTARPDHLRRIPWGVHVAAKLVPHATCLTQALAAQFLLACVGHVSTIRIGVTAEDGGRLAAHAWLINNDKILLGDNQELDRYAPLVDLSLPSA
jgi:hypothetical protein